MAKSSGSARRVNRSIYIAFAILAVAAGASAILGTPKSSPDVTVTTDPPRSTHSGSGIRPAETVLSWFDHSMSVEQFDYEMPSLSCADIKKSLTPDICAVARSTSGDFMLVGAESFWDPAEKDSEDFAQIPLMMTLYSLRKGNGPSRAVSVLDGSIKKAFTSVKVTIDVAITQVNGSDVMVLHRRLADPKADAYSYWDSVQILAASSTGAPTVVATYDGARMSVQSTGSSLIISALRYSSPSANKQKGDWTTNITLTPSQRDLYSWNEEITSGPRNTAGVVDVKIVSSYTFPTARISPLASASNA